MFEEKNMAYKHLQYVSIYTGEDNSQNNFANVSRWRDMQYYKQH